MGIKKEVNEKKEKIVDEEILKITEDKIDLELNDERPGIGYEIFGTGDED